MSGRNGLTPINRRAQNGGLSVTTSTGKVTRQSPSFASTDVVFIIDTTGSMLGKIQGLLARANQFADKIASCQIDWRIAVVGFGDLTVHGDTIQATGFSNKLETVKRWINSIPRNSGGSNDGESSLDALDRALSFTTYRPNAIKVFVFMTDEPALMDHFTPEQIIKRLKQSGTITYVISDPIDYFQRMAKETAGKWFQISSQTNFLNILDQLFEKISETVEEVQTTTGGDVQKYLQLKSGK